MAAFFSGCAVLVERYGSALGIWRDYSLPRVRQALAIIDGTDALPLSELAEQQEYAFHQTMIPAYVTWNDIRQVQDVCAGIYGDDAEFVAFELSQGYDNDTVAADQAVVHGVLVDLEHYVDWWPQVRAVASLGALKSTFCYACPPVHIAFDKQRVSARSRPARSAPDATATGCGPTTRRSRSTGSTGPTCTRCRWASSSRCSPRRRP